MHPPETPDRRDVPSVLHVTTARTWRGGEQQVFYLMQGLASRGATQRLLAPPGSALARRAAAAGLPVTPWRVRNEADAFALGRLLEEVRRLGPDALHLHTSQAHGLGAVAARLAGRRRPQVVVTRRVEYSIFRHAFLGLDRWKYDPGADVVLCVSSRVRDVLRGDGITASRLVVVPDGIDTARFVPQPDRRLEVRAVWGIPESAWVVGNVSHADPAKGQRHLLEAFARLAAGDPDAHLLVVGSGKELPALKARAAELGLGPRVTFTAFQRNVPSLLDAMDVFAFPSLSEGLGCAVLEAAASRTPIVATAVGGIPEAIRHEQEGLLVPPADPAALLAALRRMRANPDRAAELAEAARRRAVEDYDVTRMVDRTVAVYAARRAATLASSSVAR